MKKLKSINLKLIFFYLFSLFLIVRINEITDWNSNSLYNSTYDDRFLIIFLILVISIFSFFSKFFEKKDYIFFYPIILLILSQKYNFALSFFMLIFMSKVFNDFLDYYKKNKYSYLISFFFISLIIFYPLIKNFGHETIFINNYWTATRFGLGYIHPKEQALAIFFLFLILIHVHKNYKLLKYLTFFALVFITNSRALTVTFFVYSLLNLFITLSQKDKIYFIRFIKFFIFPFLILFFLLQIYNFDYEFYNKLSSGRLNIIKLIFNEQLPNNFSTDNSYLLVARDNILFFYLIIPWFFFLFFKFQLYNLYKLDQFKILLISLLIYSIFDLGLFSATNLLSLICFSRYYKLK